jgi:hypothetical protein
MNTDRKNEDWEYMYQEDEEDEAGGRIEPLKRTIGSEVLLFRLSLWLPGYFFTEGDALFAARFVGIPQVLQALIDQPEARLFEVLARF